MMMRLVQWLGLVVAMAVVSRCDPIIIEEQQLERAEPREIKVLRTASKLFGRTAHGEGNGNNMKLDQQNGAMSAKNKAIIDMIAKKMVTKMDLSKIFSSNACPEVFTPEMCRKDSNGAFYVWMRELRQRALVKQLEEETARKLEKKLLNWHLNDPDSMQFLMNLGLQPVSA